MPLGWAGLAAGKDPSSSATPPLVPLAALLVAAATAVALLPLARTDTMAASEISRLNVIGWLSGAWLALGMFAWFRSAEVKRSTRSDYVIPRWRPAVVATVMALCAVGAACGHGWMMAEAWSRQ
ncbi:MAG: hypothetical protein GEV08_02565 [Acidimicrobiia bacterium]|nr:hypothetical protein [Acidimicrobiia bacterium]